MKEKNAICNKSNILQIHKNSNFSKPYLEIQNVLDFMAIKILDQNDEILNILQIQTI